MNTISWQDCFSALKDHVNKSLPISQVARVVPSELQQKEVALLKNTLDYEKFFFVIDNVSFRTDQVFGTFKWLGWKEEEFTLKKYYSIIHPTYLAAHSTSINELVKGNMFGIWPIQFMNPKLTITIALQHSSGDYYLFKMLSFPFQYDNRSRVLSYLSEFTLLGPYKKESFRARLTDHNGKNIEWPANLLQRIVNSFKNKFVFSAQELRILKRYAEHPALTSLDAAIFFGVRENTIITHKRRILNKAENYFQRRFLTVKEIAAYLKEHRLI